MRKLIASVALILALIFAVPAQAELSKNWLDIKAEQIKFEFGDQAGEFIYPCTHAINNPNTQDWTVKCGSMDKPQSMRYFTVHLRVQAHENPNASDGRPKVSYEILYWVTNHKAKPGIGAKYPGSTIWLRTNEPSSLHSLDLAQDIEDTDVLNARIKLN